MSEEGNDLFDELDDTKEPAGGDFADWWDPESEGEQLVGVVVEMHSAPREWTDAGEVPDTIYTVMSVGRGDNEPGVAYTPKQHKQLKQGLAGVKLGDLVQLEFIGYQRVDSQPQPMMTYEIGHLPEEEWKKLDGADDIEQLLDEYTGVTGDNRETEPYDSPAAGGGSIGGGSSGSSASAGDDSEIAQAAEALREIISIQGGSVDEGTAAELINDIRGYDVALEDAAKYAGLEIDDGVVS